MSEVISEKLDLFSNADAQLSINDNFYEKIQCRTTLPDIGIPNLLQFTANPSLSHYTDLSESLLVITGKFTKSGGANLDSSPKLAPCNSFLGSLIRNCEMYMNNKKITPPDVGYHFIHHLNNFFMPQNLQESQLELAGYFPEDYTSLKSAEQNNPQATSSVNTSLKKRSKLIADSNEFTLISKIYAVPHLISKLFPNNIRIDWNFEMNKLQFFTIQASDQGANDYAFTIKAAEIWLKRVQISPQIALAHSELMRSHNAVYPVKFMVSRTLEIPKSSFGFTFDNVLQGATMPTAIYMMFLYYS